jgi:hypothetical protein
VTDAFESDPMAQHRTMTACPLCHREDCKEHRPIPAGQEDPSEAEVSVWVNEPPVQPQPEEEPPGQADAFPKPEDTWTDRKDIA